MKLDKRPDGPSGAQQSALTVETLKDLTRALQTALTPPPAEEAAGGSAVGMVHAIGEAISFRDARVREINLQSEVLMDRAAREITVRRAQIDELVERVRAAEAQAQDMEFRCAQAEARALEAEREVRTFHQATVDASGDERRLERRPHGKTIAA